MATNVSFDGNSLQTTNIITHSIDHFSMPTKDAKMYVLAHANQSKIPFVSYPNKSIKVTGTIIDTSIANLDSRLDTFRSYFIGTDKNLDIDYNGSTRRYIATVNNLTIDRPGGLLYAYFTIDFVCTQPFGQNTASTTALTASGRTSASYTDNYTFLGTAPQQLVIATITPTALTGGTSATISFGNLNTGQQINVTRTWVANDALVIDCTQSTVTVNGVATSFTGAFPQFPSGAQTMAYYDNLTTRTFTVLVTYNAMFL